MSVWSDAVAALSPHAWYKLDDAIEIVPTATIVDSSGNDRTGTFVSGASGTSGHPALVPGDSGGASFSMTGGTVSSGAVSLPTNGVTYAMTLKSSSPGTFSRMFATNGAGNTFVEYDASPRQFINGTSVTVSPSMPASTFWNGTARLFVVVVGPTSLQWYVDGALVANHTHSTTAGTITRVDTSPTSSGWTGDVDEFVLFGTALSAAQVTTLHNAWLGAAPGAATIALAGTRRARTGAFALTSTADATLAGTRQARTGAFAFEFPNAPISVALAAERARRTGAFALNLGPAVDPAAASITLAGARQARVGTFTASVEVPVTPAPSAVALSGHAVVVAQAFGPVTMQGTQPVYSISQAATPRARQRIAVDGQDVTYFRGGITPDVTYTLVEPLLYGPGALEVPQVSACFERIGEGELSWLRAGATVEVHRVIDDAVVGTDYRGVIVAFDLSGRTLSVELGGEASGRAALRNRQVPIFPRRNDIGHQIDDAVRDLGLPTAPHLGPVTGIETMTTGGTGHLEHIQNLVAKAFTKAGRQWTIMPDEHGVYRTFIKDTETIHGTVFTDDTRTVANLRRDISEEPTRVYGTGVTPAGQRVKNGVYPGLIQGTPPPFPGLMRDGDTGEGVQVLINRLWAVGYLGLRDAAGGYDDDVHDAVLDLQTSAGFFDDGFGDTDPGWVDEKTWRALYDLDVTTGSLEGAHVEPMAERRKGRKWNRSGSGTITGLNPAYDPEALVVDRNIDYGSGLRRRQMFNRSKAELHDSNDPNWVGDITFNTGALIRGEKAIGATLAKADVMDARELQPGMNLWLPQFDGGTLVHVSACQVDGEGIVTATVDTRFRDAMEVWEVIARNRESRRDPARNRNRQHRSSTIIKDSIGEWDEIGGLLGNDVPLEAGWNVVKVVGAAEGTISRIRLLVQTVTSEGGAIGVEPHEFACAVFGREVGRGDLTNLVPQPLSAEGKKAWRRKATRDQLKAKWLLYSAGTDEEPCGYGSDLKSDGAQLTGEHDDDAGFAYRSEERAWLWLAVWVAEPTTLHQGRVMWPQLEAGV